MGILHDLIELLKQNAPALMALVALFFRNEAINATNKQKIAELELKLKENHEKVDRNNANKSVADIVDDAIKSGRGF